MKLTLVPPLDEEPNTDLDTSWLDVFRAILDGLPEDQATDLLRQTVTAPLVFVAEAISLHATGQIELSPAARRALRNYLTNEQTADNTWPA